MVPVVAKMLANMFLQLMLLVDEVFTKLDGWQFYMAAFIIFTISRFLLIPFLRGGFGGVGSDLVKRVIKESRSTDYKESRGFGDKVKGEK